MASCGKRLWKSGLCILGWSGLTVAHKTVPMFGHFG